MSNPTRTFFKPHILAITGLLILTLGSTLSAAGQRTTALNIEAASTYQPKNPTTRRSRSVSVNDKKDSNKTSEPAREAVLDKKQEEIDDAIEEGNKARDKSDYETALRSYRRITNDLNPKDERAHYGLGNIYAALYCSQSAIEAYQAALEINSKYSEAQIGLSYVYLNDERFEDALQAFKKAIALAPESIAARIGLGIALSKRGRSQEAVAELSGILNSQSTAEQDQASVHLALGNIYQNEMKWKEAIAEAETAGRTFSSQHTTPNQENSHLASAYVSLASAQVSSAVEQFVSLGKRSIQDRATLAAAAKWGGDRYSNKAIELGYRYPHVHYINESGEGASGTLPGSNQRSRRLPQKESVSLRVN